MYVFTVKGKGNGCVFVQGLIQIIKVKIMDPFLNVVYGPFKVYRMFAIFKCEKSDGITVMIENGKGMAENKMGIRNSQ